MVEQFHLPLRPELPKTANAELVALERAIEALYTTLARRIETLVTVDVIANQPTATGEYRFFYATDTGVLYFDDGSWNAV